MRVDGQRLLSALLYIYFAYLALILPLRWLAGWFLAVLIHETGHYLAVRFCGGQVLSVTVAAGGLVMGTTPLTRGKLMLCILCGPLFGALPILLYRWFPALAVCSLLLTIYNLIPLRPLDGGKLLEQLFYGHRKLIRITEKLVIVVGVGFSLYWSMFYRAGVFLFIVVAQLIMKNRKFTCKRGAQRVQ